MRMNVIVTVIGKMLVQLDGDDYGERGVRCDVACLFRLDVHVRLTLSCGREGYFRYDNMQYSSNCIQL